MMRGGVRDAEICDDTWKCVGSSRIRRKWEAVVFGGARLVVPWAYSHGGQCVELDAKANRRFGLDCNGVICASVLGCKSAYLRCCRASALSHCRVAAFPRCKDDRLLSLATPRRGASMQALSCKA